MALLVVVTKETVLKVNQTYNQCIIVHSNFTDSLNLLSYPHTHIVIWIYTDKGSFRVKGKHLAQDEYFPVQPELNQSLNILSRDPITQKLGKLIQTREKAEKIKKSERFC